MRFSLVCILLLILVTTWCGGGFLLRGGSLRCPSLTSLAMSAQQTPMPDRFVLDDRDRTKDDKAPDAFFYDYPKLCFHVDDGFIKRLTQLYRERIPPGGAVLDMMSSWVSHLPGDVRYERVCGHGLNFEELQKNPRLDEFKVTDLNAEPRLPFEDIAFDAVICAVSVQYLQQPERVFADVYRVLRPGGVAIFSFSNRMFFSKAIRGWTRRGDAERVRLVSDYFRGAVRDGFTAPEVLTCGGGAFAGLLADLGRVLLGLNVGGDPFFAVVSYKDFAPKSEGGR